MASSDRALERPAGASGGVLVVGIVLASLAEAIAGTVLGLGRADIIGATHAIPDQFAWLDMAYVASKLIGFSASPWLVSRSRPLDALLVATLVLGAACAAAATTTSLATLVLLRAVQGFAGGVVLVTGQSLLFWRHRSSQQPLLQAIFAIGSVVAPATLAPALEGAVLDSEAWSAVFFSVFPLTLTAAGALMWAAGEPLQPSEKRRPDWQGMTLISAVLMAATYVFTQGSRWDWFEDRKVVSLSLLAAACFVLMLAHQQRKDPHALFDYSVLRDEQFVFAFIVSFIAGAALFGSAFLIPSFVVSVLGFTASEAGWLLLPSGALFVGALFVSAILMQWWRVPPIATVPAGILLVMLSMWMLAGSDSQSGVHEMMPAILLRGLGLGFLFLSITLIAFSRLTPGSLPSGIAIFNIGRQLGGLIGVAGLQTAIDHQNATNQAVIGSAFNPGSPLLAARLSSATSMLIARGMDAEAAAKAATGLISRSVVRQATVLAFDRAFAIVALIFVVAAPMLICLKIALSHGAGRDVAKQQEARAS
jgi:DHA2 family multidrug resistance protein